MQRDTFVVRQTFLQWLHKRSNPGRIVNLCFLIVLVFSTLLTWREVVVLEEAYISSQRNHLDTVASSLDRQLQNSVDRMLLFRQGMHDAIETPLAFDVLQDAVSRFNTVRMLPTWQLAVDKKRTLPINGVSDAFVDKTTLLNRDAERISHEISAALEVGYLLRLASSRAQTEARVIYVSRAGFFLSTDTPDRAGDITARYYNLVTQSWFTQQSERNNRARAVRWFISTPSSWTGDERTITASVPIYFDHYWYGVVAMDFTLDTMQRLLTDATEDRTEGEYQLYDTRLNMIAPQPTREARLTSLTNAKRRRLPRRLNMIPAAVSASGAGLSPGSGSIISMASSCGSTPCTKGCRTTSAVSALCWRCCGRSLPPCC